MVKTIKQKLSFLLIPSVQKSWIGAVIYDSVFITAYINIIIQDITPSPALIGIIFLVKKVVRSMCDIPIGILIDKKLGLKKAIIIAILLKIGFVAMLCCRNFPCLILSAMLEGISLSFFRGKICVLHYNIFENEGILEKHYITFNGIYAISVSIVTVILSCIGAIFWETGGKEMVVIASIISLLVAMWLLQTSISVHSINKIPKYNKDNTKTRIYNKRHYLDTIKNIKNEMAKLNKQAIGVSLILGLCCLGWQINTMNQFLAMQMNYTEQGAAFIFRLGCTIMSVGGIISIVNRSRNIKLPITLLTVLFLLDAVLPFIVASKYLVLLVMPYLLIFVTCENIIRKYVLDIAPSDSRSFTISIATTITSIFSAIIMYAFHFIGWLTNYMFSYSFVFAILFLCMLYGIKLMNSKADAKLLKGI